MCTGQLPDGLNTSMPAGQPVVPAGQALGQHACGAFVRKCGAGDVSDEQGVSGVQGAPGDVLRSHAKSFLQARGTDPVGKGTKRKASETSFRKRPAAASSKVRKTNPAPVLKRPSASKETRSQEAVPERKVGKQWTNRSFDAKQWGHCRVEFYSAKSYIRFFCEKKNRLCMVIGSARGQHQEICDRLVPRVQKGKSREKLLEIRPQLEQSFDGKD